jgi:hypothetical protein
VRRASGSTCNTLCAVQMLAALDCAAPQFHTALLAMLRSLDIFLEVSQAAMQLFHERDGAPALLRFARAVLDDAMTHVHTAESGERGDELRGGLPRDVGTVPASHRVVVRVRLSQAVIIKGWLTRDQGSHLLSVLPL